MYKDIFKWRISASSVATDLRKSLLVRLGIPTPSQVQYRDHAQKISQSEGGMARHGFKNVEILWTKLTPCQARTLRQIVEDSKTASGGTGYLYMTIKPLDGTYYDWLDIAGKADLSDIAPDAPIIGASGYIHSNITLNLNNVQITSTNPIF